MIHHAPHHFHIPVMGLAYTIDSPIKVARFGISSALSIVEDRLIEMMRSYYYPKAGLEYEPIPTSTPDYRAKRIADYLNLVNHMVQQQVARVKEAAFETGSEIVQYFEMLPADSTLKKLYLQFAQTHDERQKQQMEATLRRQVVAGSIDVNLMTKVDKENYDKSGNTIEDGSDAVAALRGYVNSELSNSSIVFSAGMNPRLYNYLDRCDQFDADEDGVFQKRVVIKVSDYRSALIQGKYLAKKGIWVSEFRIESGLNCGGHAFATDGFLLGPILHEFSSHRQELADTMLPLYNEALTKKGKRIFKYAPQINLSVQGGIGTYEEDEFLRKQYHLQSTGWGTPFLLVPEATTVDEDMLSLLCSATKDDMELSHNSPLGVRFHYLKNTTSHKEKLTRIADGKPGSPCTEKHLAFNTEFTEKPICTASTQYQKLKTKQLQSLDLPRAEYEKQLKLVHDKECLCIGLSNPAALSYEITFVKKLHAATICPGPNIVNFSKQVSLPTMVDHIYGRKNIMENEQRPHMFIAELRLYLDYLHEQLADEQVDSMAPKQKKYYSTFISNLQNGITYYSQLPAEAITGHGTFVSELESAKATLNAVSSRLTAAAN